MNDLSTLAWYFIQRNGKAVDSHAHLGGCRGIDQPLSKVFALSKCSSSRLMDDLRLVIFFYHFRINSVWKDVCTFVTLYNISFCKHHVSRASVMWHVFLEDRITCLLECLAKTCETFYSFFEPQYFLNIKNFRSAAKGWTDTNVDIGISQYYYIILNAFNNFSRLWSERLWQ